MSRFRRMLALLIISGGYILYGLYQDPPLPPEPPHEVTRGSAVTPQQIYYEQWLRAAKVKQAAIGAQATSVTFDTDVVGWVVGVLTIFSLLITGLAKYVITPMILKQLAISLDKLDEKFCTRQDLIVALMSMQDGEKSLLQLSNIWKAENR